MNWKLVSFIFKLILAISERGFDVLVMKLVRLLLVIWGCEIHLIYRFKLNESNILGSYWFDGLIVKYIRILRCFRNY